MTDDNVVIYNLSQNGNENISIINVSALYDDGKQPKENEQQMCVKKQKKERVVIIIYAQS